ncbi:NmrA family transcriptional regulator [Spongiactinospora rosea]|uniref:NmrA family transcriptional regulator n=1 Tax=Spongiactinospora rosea TaxID=2248750 RepID=A0A366LWG5_9ACTN|nr:NAD(P)H-binding protein [Spongiactinospora rosea]RBQ17920.1 NmrA family transcriptional regulator [Spongiactinospora rosea]
MIVITTPTGQIGRQTLDRVLAAGTGAKVRVIVRDAARLGPDVRDRVEVIEGSHGDSGVVTAAFAGADAVFWLVPPDPSAPDLDTVYSGFTRPAAVALKEQGVKRVVGVSALGRGTSVAGRAGYITASLAMDDLLAATGVGYRALALPSFMDNLLRQANLIRHHGVFRLPIPGDHKAPACATADIAAVAADLLLDDTWSGVEEVPLLGPEDLSYDEMAQIMSDVLQRPIRFEQESGADFTARLIRFGASPAMARAALDMWQAKAAGLDAAVPRTARSSTPTTFRQWCQDVFTRCPN